MTLSDPIAAFEQVYIEISGAVNPVSTSRNAGYQVTSFNQSMSTIETAENLSLVQLNPALLTELNVYPDSDILGETTALNIEFRVSQEIPCQSDRSGCSVVLRSPVRNPYQSSIQKDTFFDNSLLKCQVSNSVRTIKSNLLKIFSLQMLSLIESLIFL